MANEIHVTIRSKFHERPFKIIQHEIKWTYNTKDTVKILLLPKCIHVDSPASHTVVQKRDSYLLFRDFLVNYTGPQNRCKIWPIKYKLYKTLSTILFVLHSGAKRKLQYRKFSIHVCNKPGKRRFKRASRVISCRPCWFLKTVRSARSLCVFKIVSGRTWDIQRRTDCTLRH